MRKFLLACLLLTACSGTPTPAPKATPSPAGGTATVKAKLALQGAMRGFAGDAARFTAADAPKIAIELQDEAGKTAYKAVAPDPHGSFNFQQVLSGAYFAVATLPDKTRWSALVRTDRGDDNFLSPGTTLATLWAKRQLAAKLVFVEDLPYPDLLSAAIQLDADLKAKDLSLKDTDEARAGQLDELVAGDANLADRLGQIETLLGRRAATNLENPPPYASQAEYDAKKQALQKKT
jgi:hypothetical protein